MLRLSFGTLAALALALGGCASDDGGTPPDGSTGDTTLNSSGRFDGGYDIAVDVGQADTMAPDIGVDAPNNSAWQPMGNPATSSINAIWGSSTNSIFAVGAAGLVLHYDGTQWEKQISSTTKDLHAVYGIVDQTSGEYKEVYAVGDDEIVRYDGTNWKDESAYYAMHGVWGTKLGDKAWAVGESGKVLNKVTGGTTTYWSSSPSTDVGGQLNAIWGVSQSEIYAVGEAGAIVKFDGTAWSKMVTPSGVTADLQAIWGTSGSDIWAVGLDGTALHFDGAAWSVVSVKGSSSYFYGVWGSAANDVYVVGNGVFKQEESVFHWDGSTWTPLPPATYSSLNGIWGASASDIFIVGNFNILRYKGLP